VNVNGASERVAQLIDGEFSRKVTEINDEEISRRTKEIIHRINQKREGEPLDEEVQKSLAEAIGLLTDVALTDMTVAFLAGFSERFAGDVVDHLDDRFDQGEPPRGAPTRRA
jgi:hypothetical protein